MISFFNFNIKIKQIHNTMTSKTNEVKANPSSTEVQLIPLKQHSKPLSLHSYNTNDGKCSQNTSPFTSPQCIQSQSIMIHQPVSKSPNMSDISSQSMLSNDPSPRVSPIVENNIIFNESVENKK